MTTLDKLEKFKKTHDYIFINNGTLCLSKKLISRDILSNPELLAAEYAKKNIRDIEKLSKINESFRTVFVSIFRLHEWQNSTTIVCNVLSLLHELTYDNRMLNSFAQDFHFEINDF